MLAAPLVRQMIESVEEALRRLKAGQNDPRAKVVHGRGSRSRRCPRRRDGRQTHRHGHPQVGDLGDQTRDAREGLKKLKWEATKAGEKVQKQLSERQLKTLDTEYVAKVAGKLTVVPESDARQAVVLDARRCSQRFPKSRWQSPCPRGSRNSRSNPNVRCHFPERCSPQFSHLPSPSARSTSRPARSGSAATPSSSCRPITPGFKQFYEHYGKLMVATFAEHASTVMQMIQNDRKAARFWSRVREDQQENLRPLRWLPGHGVHHRRLRAPAPDDPRQWEPGGPGEHDGVWPWLARCTGAAGSMLR